MYDQLLNILEVLAPSLQQSDKLVEVARVLLPLLARDEPEPPRPRPCDVKRRRANARRRSNGRAKAVVRAASNGNAAPNGAGAARGDRVQAAENFLRQALQKGPASVSQIEQAFRRQKISKNSLGRARTRLQVVTSSEKFAPMPMWSFEVLNPYADPRQLQRRPPGPSELQSMHVDLLNEETARSVNMITAAVVHRGEPLHALCLAAAERLPTRLQPPRRISSPVLQPRAPERASQKHYRENPAD